MFATVQQKCVFSLSVRRLQVSKKKFSILTGFSEDGTYLKTLHIYREKLFLGRDLDFLLASQKASIV